MSAVVDIFVPESSRSVDTGAAEALSSLLVPVEPLALATTVDEVSEIFLAPASHALLSLPVVTEGRVVGIVSRYQIMKIYTKLYGREVYGRRSVERLINPTPLQVDAGLPVEAATQYVTERMSFPVMDDFVITREGRYAGMGVVLHLLKAMEQRVARKNQELASAYASLQSSQSQLIQSEKMASLGQMVAGVTHEINTPLGYVRNNIEILHGAFHQARTLLAAHTQLLTAFEQGLIDERAAEAHLATIEQYRGEFSDEAMADLNGLLGDTLYGVDQIAELVVNLKNFSRLDQAKVENVSLNDCLDSALVIGRNHLKRKATIVKHYGELPKVKCSPSQINQVFLNLLNNAAQAMEREGEITLTTWADAHHVYAAVADTGRGIPEDVLPRIFDPFFTTKPVGEGTGLGLSICYQILQQHGGGIDVKSQAGLGTTFTVRLPRESRATTSSPGELS